MSEPATTRLSSKGQVVIPESVRKRLKLPTGARFVVVGEGDIVILKRVAPPDLANFDVLIREARRQARTAGLKPKDVRRALARARSRA